MWLTPKLTNTDTTLRQDRRLDLLTNEAPTIAEMFCMPERWLEEETSFVPSIDLQETDNAYVINAEMPGMDPNNVNITVNNGVLDLKGEKKEEKESGETGNTWTERRYGAFHRRIPLDQEIKEDEVKASYKDGILRIEVPKAEKAKGGKSIPIETDQSS
ncbi:MAG: Hsp20/alpha crystallin family protein [Thermodesulfobacteriota bacterium]